MPRRFRISYPVTEGVASGLSRYPNIAARLSLSGVDRSELEIIRVLGNLHYEGLTSLAALVDGDLPLAGPIGVRLLQAKDPFEFAQSLAELYLFHHLRQHLGERVVPSDLPPNRQQPDIEVRLGDSLIRIEVYTPIDFIGFQLFDRYVRQVLKYLEVERGYSLRVTVDPAEERFTPNTEHLSHALRMGSQEDVHAWLHEFAVSAQGWLGAESPEPMREFVAPGGEMLLRVELLETHEEPEVRDISVLGGTRSTDTRLFFEVGTAADTARSQWGRKIRDKLFQRQCGPSSPETARILVVNFSMADTGWPDFICGERFTERFAGSIRCIVGAEIPYDAIVPAQLGPGSYFGKVAIIDAAKEGVISRFLDSVNMSLMHHGGMQR